jgi:hypothetical protein
MGLINNFKGNKMRHMSDEYENKFTYHYSDDRGQKNW